MEHGCRLIIAVGFGVIRLLMLFITANGLKNMIKI